MRGRLETGGEEGRGFISSKKRMHLKQDDKKRFCFDI